MGVVGGEMHAMADERAVNVGELHALSGEMPEGWQHAPCLLDSSVSEGPCVGGTIVWLHGENFSADLHVFFGDVFVKKVDVVSPALIKCVAPEAQMPRRHTVRIQVINPTTGSRGANHLAYTYAPASTGGLPEAMPETLERLLAALDRAAVQATVVGGGLSAVQLLSSLDEHGMSLVEYTRALRKMGGQDGNSSYREEAIENASEIQHGLAELARTQQVDAVAKAIANRPDLEQLQQRHILLPPDADSDKMAKRKRLEEGLAQRPEPEEMQLSGMLQPRPPIKNSERAARLEEGLAHRPAIEELQQRGVLHAQS